MNDKEHRNLERAGKADTDRILTIPNVLSFFRLALIPVIIVLYAKNEVWWAYCGGSCGWHRVHPANRKRRQCGLVYHPCGTESFALCRGKRLHRGRWYKPDGGRSQFGCVFSVHHPSHRQLYKSVSKAQKRCGKSGDRHPWQVCRKAVSADTAGTPAKLCHERNADTLRI